MTRFDFKKMIGSRIITPELTSLTALSPQPEAESSVPSSSTPADRVQSKESKIPKILGRLRPAPSRSTIRPTISSPTLVSSSLELSQEGAWHAPHSAREPILPLPLPPTPRKTAGTHPEDPGTSFSTRPFAPPASIEISQPSQVSPSAYGTYHPSPPPRSPIRRVAASAAAAGVTGTNAPPSFAPVVPSPRLSEDEEIKRMRARIEAAEEEVKALRAEFDRFLVRRGRTRDSK